MREQAREALQTFFGFADFREGQGEVVESILSGENAVVIMPTGGGKSLCYQLPALMLDGITLVVSPLIALMKDQVDSLKTLNIPTTFINSSLSYSETKKRLSEIRRGVYKLVYIAPERFRSEAFTDAMSEVQVKLLAIDEAHCISHWGHDFRPDYLRLKKAAELLGNPQIVALTATATQKVRDDIIAQLGLTNPSIFVAGFDRPNLHLQVRHPQTEKEKILAIKQILKHSGGSGIIYTATRKAVETVAAKLKMADLSVEAYHAGMTDIERSRAQEKFMSGECQAIVATNAFGMGIDKSDIRFVIHFQVPGSIEAYYQEIGRAGRDGLDADCVLLFNYADTRTHQFFIEGSHPNPELINDVYDEIYSFGLEYVELSAKELANRLKTRNEMAIYSALVILEKAGHIERGRPSNTALLAMLRKPIDEALSMVGDDSNEGGFLRDLIFSRNVSDREQTEFDLTTVCNALGLSENEARRSLSSLSALEILEYRNAFQGRGIHLLDGERQNVLRIDTKELAARLAAENWKLRKMLDYCYYKKCLRGFILNYFGERKYVNNCGTCSNCRPSDYKIPKAGTLTLNHQAGDAVSPSAIKSQPFLKSQLPSPQTKPAMPATHEEKALIDNAPTGAELRAKLRALSEKSKPMEEIPLSKKKDSTRQLTEAEIIVVKKILSCVARMRGRFGKGAVAAVLKGSKSKQVVENNLHQLSTYGLLRELSQEEITEYIKALIESDCIMVGQKAYPTVSLTEIGREVMLGQREIRLNIPE
ncbi:MAG: ATP-dependent DNA helicase RecQ [Acidobacteriota bacterium]